MIPSPLLLASVTGGAQQIFFSIHTNELQQALMLGNYGWALEKMRSSQSYRDHLRRAECWMLHPPAERHVHASCQAFQPASPTQWLTYGCGLCKVPAQSQDQMKWYEQAFPKKGKFTLLHSSFSLGPPQKFPGVKGRQTAAADLPLFYSQAAIINLSGKKKKQRNKKPPTITKPKIQPKQDMGIPSFLCHKGGMRAVQTNSTERNLGK